MAATGTINAITSTATTTAPVCQTTDGITRNLWEVIVGWGLRSAHGRPADYTPLQGARFEIHFEKLRQLAGAEATPFEAFIESFNIEAGSYGVRWLAQDLRPPVLQQAAALFQAGMTVRQVAAMLEISRSEADRLQLAAVLKGLFQGGGEDRKRGGGTRPGSARAAELMGVPTSRP